VDSTEVLFERPMALDNAHKFMKKGTLEVVAREGIEPPTPAFSGLLIDKAKRFRISVD
jgi:hypothetical protein